MESSVTLTLSHAVSKRLRLTSSQKLFPFPKQTRALLSIRPPYADAIFRGQKRFEFRRTIFRKPVNLVVVYITSPVSLVVGEFEVKEILSDSVSDLWNRTSDRAGIDRTRFFQYFAGCDVGYAIVIGRVRRYRRPLDLASNFGLRPPQSFVYI